MEHTSHRRIRPRTVFLLILIVPLAVAILSFFIRFGMYNYEHGQPPTSDLATYRRTALIGWNIEDPYAMFPSRETLDRAVRADYQFKKETSPFPLLFDNDIFAVVTCTYTASDFEAEYARLKQNFTPGTRSFYDGVSFVAVSSSTNCAYALVDEENASISYLSMQNVNFSAEFLDRSLLPRWARDWSRSASL